MPRSIWRANYGFGYKLPIAEIIRVYIDTDEQEWIAPNFEEYLHKAFNEEL